MKPQLISATTRSLPIVGQLYDDASRAYDDASITYDGPQQGEDVGPQLSYINIIKPQLSYIDSPKATLLKLD